MQLRELNPEVLQADGQVVWVTRADIDRLKARALANPRRRARICAHPGPDEATHEMLVALGRENYLRPHFHPGKVESFHALEGLFTVVLFTDEGEVLEVVPMGDYASGRAMFYRHTRPTYHTLLPETDVVVFHEVTQGPFSREGTVLASWAPAEGTDGKLQAYLQDLRRRIGIAPDPVAP